MVVINKTRKDRREKARVLLRLCYKLTLQTGAQIRKVRVYLIHDLLFLPISTIESRVS